MTARTFVLGEGDDGERNCCVRVILTLILIGILALAVILGFYVFKSWKGTGNESACGAPVMDPNGLSNWTTGANFVAFTCFPGHSMENINQVVISQCVNESWSPPPPPCVALPLRLKCPVDTHGLQGTVSIWQFNSTTPTYVHGVLDTVNVDKSSGILSETIILSRKYCYTSTEFNGTLTSTNGGVGGFGGLAGPIELDSRQSLEIRFQSSAITAFEETKLRITMVFLDPVKDLTGTLVSLTQGNVTLIMNNPVVPGGVEWTLTTGGPPLERDPTEFDDGSSTSSPRPIPNPGPPPPSPKSKDSRGVVEVEESESDLNGSNNESFEN